MATMQRNFPALRFPGFKREWCKTTIGQNFEFKNGLNKEKEFFGYGTPIINFKDVFNLSAIRKAHIKGLVDLSDKEIENFSVEKGDVFFTRTSETINEVGISATLVEDIENCVFSGFVLRARPVNKELDDIYKSYCFSIGPVRKEIVTKSSYTTRALTSGRLLNKVYFRYPYDLLEQQKIADFLSSIDARIEQLEKKRVLLEQYKKGIMQKLFGQEIRFADVQGKEYPDWEQRMLGDVSSITNGETNRVDSGEHGKYAFFDRSQDVRRSDKYIFDGEAVIVAGEGKEFLPKHYVGKFDLHQRSYAIMRFSNISGKYVYYLLTQNKGYLSKMAVGSTMKSLRLPMFIRMPIQYPCIDEQQKIANFLSSIDKKIELINEQMGKSREYKKGLIQRMFV